MCVCVCVADLPLCLRDTLIMNICIHESSNLFVYSSNLSLQTTLLEVELDGDGGE